MNVYISFLQISLIGVILLTSAPPTSGGGVTKIDPELKRKIDSAPAGSTWDVIIGFKKDPNLLDTIEASVSNIEERHLKTYNSVLKMQQHSEECQGRVITSLKEFTELKEITPLWISNDLFLRSAGKEVIYMLGDNEKPGNENITVIEEDEGYPLNPGKDIGARLEFSLKERRETQTRQLLLSDETWGLQNINAPAWWDKDFNGSGVIIGHIDSGVDSRHPSLKWNWVGKGPGWKDPMEATNTFPFEDDKRDSHGTHTLGILVGRGMGTSNFSESDVPFRGVGVAPGARWISCIACRDQGPKKGIQCVRSEILKCGAFMTCPTMDKKCLYVPEIVSNSYGCDQTQFKKCRFTTSLVPMIDAWHRHGIIPVFVAGNNGDKGCTTIDDVGDYADVITVGNVDKFDKLDSKSSLGPPQWRYSLDKAIAENIYKPDIVAPGEHVISTVYTGMPSRFAYAFKSGTSQAAPHVAGAIALLLSRTEGLSYYEVKQILINNAVPNDKLTADNGVSCGKLGDSVRPNFKFGWGRLRLPHPDNLTSYPVRPPRRKMPPPPDYSTLADDSTPPSVKPGMVGVVGMALVAFLMNAAMDI